MPSRSPGAQASRRRSALPQPKRNGVKLAQSYLLNREAFATATLPGLIWVIKNKPII